MTYFNLFSRVAPLATGLLLAGCKLSPCTDGSEPAASGESCICEDGAEVEDSECEGLSAAAETETPTDSAVVFEGTPPELGDWISNGELGAYDDDEEAVHPGALDAGAKAVLSFDCAGATHTQLSFWALRRGNTPLKLYVDGTLHSTITMGNRDGWLQTFINVPRGKHTYRFEIEAERDIASPFVLDTFACTDADVAPDPNLHVDFDDAFFPTEVGGDWVVGSVEGVESGDAAIHAPSLAAGARASMTFDCGDAEHTQLSFWAFRRGSTPLELRVDGELHSTIVMGNRDGWLQTFINVPLGTHEYTFEISAERDIGPAFVLDTFACKNAEEKPDPNHFVDFDDAFYPTEVNGDWVVGSVEGVESGEAALYPRKLSAGGGATMSFDCDGAPHSQLSFWALRRGRTPMELWIDGELHSTITMSNRDGWLENVIDVELGPHEYVFKIIAETEIGPAFVLDTFSCKQ